MHADNSTTPHGEKDDAQTRWEDVRHLEDLLGITFNLDACATLKTKKADFWFDKKYSGLENDWGSGRYIYCNPPFSKIGVWFKKCWEESSHNVVVGCCPNDPSTRWWQKYVLQATFIIVPTGKQARRSFLRPDGSEFNSSPTGPVCWPVWCRPRVPNPIYIYSQFPIIEKK